jgi:hypothetical protein
MQKTFDNGCIMDFYQILEKEKYDH